MPARRTRSLRDTVPDAKKPPPAAREEIAEETTQPEIEPRAIERGRAQSGVRARRARRAVLEVDAAPRRGDPRREDDE